MRRGRTGRARRTATLLLPTLLLAGLLAACGDGDETAADRETGPGTTGTATPEASAAARDDSGDARAVLDPEYAVDPPGPRDSKREPLVPADILVLDQDQLNPDVVRRIEALPGVEAATSFALRQVSIENKVYNVAAVDLAGYRRFTDASSADLEDQWTRVAGGEVAVAADLRKRIPTDDEGYLDLNTEGEDQRVHVGAWAPQVEQVDLVVNTARGEALGMTRTNALLISTGQTAPDELRKPIGQIVGDEVSVQNLDSVARYGLDTDAYQTAVLVGSFGDAVGTFNYTPIGGGRIAPEPSWVASHISTQVVPILGSVTCNNALFPQLKAALQEVITTGLADKIDPAQYAGCYYPRFIAGSTRLSNHSFGLALDLNTPGNQRGTVGEMDRGVVAIFKKWGFAWGGDWNYTDPMHFELNRIVRPGG